MALPTFVSVGTQVNATTGISVAWPGTYADGDLGLLVVESANQSVTTPSGWTQVTGSPQGTGTGGVAGGVRCMVFYKFASGVEANVSVSDSGDHTIGQIFVFRGVDSTTPINAGAGSVQSSAATSWTLPGVTTTVNDCLIVHCISSDRDSSATTNVDGYTNSNLANITERADAATFTASGGAIVLVTGEMATAGSTGTTSCTSAASVTGAFVTIALAPAAAGGSYSLDGSPGAVTIDGASSALEVSRLLDASPGNLSVSGTSVALEVARSLNALPANLSVVGSPATLSVASVGAYSADAEPMAMSIVGFPATLVAPSTFDQPLPAQTGPGWTNNSNRIKDDDEQVMKLVIEAFSKLAA